VIVVASERKDRKEGERKVVRERRREGRREVGTEGEGGWWDGREAGRGRRGWVGGSEGVRDGGREGGRKTSNGQIPEAGRETEFQRLIAGIARYKADKTKKREEKEFVLMEGRVHV